MMTPMETMIKLLEDAITRSSELRHLLVRMCEGDLKGHVDDVAEKEIKRVLVTRSPEARAE